jgi:hypothetical protein
MLAHAFLVVAALAERTRHPSPAGLIPMTCNEVQRLFSALVARPTREVGHRLRCRCGDDDIRRARTCHYRRQAAWHP